MTWKGQSQKHSLASRGVKVKEYKPYTTQWNEEYKKQSKLMNEYTMNIFMRMKNKTNITMEQIKTFVATMVNDLEIADNVQAMVKTPNKNYINNVYENMTRDFHYGILTKNDVKNIIKYIKPEEVDAFYDYSRYYIAHS